MERYLTAPAGRPMREAIAFLVYDLILIVLAYTSTELWMTLVCALLSVIAAIRAIKLFASVMSLNDQLVEEDLGLRIDGPRDRPKA